MKGTIADGCTKKIFSGKVLTYKDCINVSHTPKPIIEDFYDIQLDVKGCKDIYKSFDKYTSIEVLEGDNQYDAGIHGMQDAKKSMIFLTFPPVLTIYLKRFDIDSQTKRVTKIHDKFEFYQRLELDKYIAQPDKLLNGGLELDDIIREEQQYAASNVYILHSVVVHQGDAGGGHYYAYIRPTTEHFDYSSSTSSGQWYRFNDKVVKEVTELEAIDQCYGREFGEQESNSSAYMLVYIRESEAKEIMRPIEEKDIPRDLKVRLDTDTSNGKLVKPLSELSVHEVGIVLEALKLGKYKETLLSNEIDGKRLMECNTVEDVKGMGISMTVKPSIMLHEIKNWKETGVPIEYFSTNQAGGEDDVNAGVSGNDHENSKVDGTSTVQSIVIDDITYGGKNDLSVDAFVDSEVMPSEAESNGKDHEESIVDDSFSIINDVSDES